MNIYEGSVSHSDVFYRDYTTSWDKQLDEKKKYYEEQGYKVVFVFKASPCFNAARVVLYNKNDDIPPHMQNYRHKYVRLNGHWCLESQLGICDKCGNYKVLTCMCKDGWLCDDCRMERVFNGQYSKH